MKKFKLNPKVKAEWVKALRSGKYKQGEDYLHRYNNGDERYCCLGVARAIHLENAEKDGSSEMLIEKFAPEEIQTKLSGFNDKFKSFKWIAAYIERYL